jgi:hypothetical protein
MNTILEYALQYHNKNLSVIPIISREKKPAIQSWESNKVIRADKEQIEKWFSNNEFTNISIVTGSISGLIAFDIDGDAAKKYFYNIVEGLDSSLSDIIRNTTSIKTGSGNTNLIIGFNPQDFQEGERIRNAVLWRSNGAKHNEIRLYRRRIYCCSSFNTPQWQ